MHAIVFAPNQIDRLLLAMAADAADADLSLDFVVDRAAAIDQLTDSLSFGAPVDLVIVLSDGDAAGLEIVSEIDRDPILWPTPTFVMSARANDDERVLAYARGADWYEQAPHRFSTAVAMLDQLPDRVGAIVELVGGPVAVDLAAGDLVEEIEAFLLKSP